MGWIPLTTSDDSVLDTPAGEEELERIRLEIGATRRRREQAVAAFEEFLCANRAAIERCDHEAAVSLPGRSFDSDQAAHTIAPVVPAPPVPVGRVGYAPRPPLDFGLFDESTTAADQRGERTRVSPRALRRSLTIAAGLLGIAALVYTWGPGRRDVATTPPGASVPTSASPVLPSGGTTSASESTATGTTSDAATDPGALQVELLTVETVWLRVHTDGQRVLEREVPGGQRLHYSADREIVVRAGNAGAVRIVTAEGAEQPLGRPGQPVTRSFTAAVR